MAAGAGLNRERVVGEARAMLAEGGTDGVTVRRLAARLGVTAPALYNHVEDRDDLLRAAADAELDALVSTVPSATDDPVAALRQLCHGYVDYALAHPETYRALFRHPPWQPVDRSDDEAMEAAAQTRTERFAVPYDACAEAIASGAFLPMPVMDAVLVIFAAVHGLVETLLLDLVPGDDEAVDAFASRVLDATFTGLQGGR